jgi:hypothetical protein
VPQLIEEQEIRIQFADMDRLVPRERISTARSPGIHLSGVIKCVLVSAGLLTPEDLSDEMPLRMCVGMAWEAFVVMLWPEILWQPGECMQDGVIGSPDGLTGDVLEEIKCTWMSRLEKSEARGVRPPPRKITEMRRWMLQLAGYLHMMGLTKARMHVLWINGDYRESGPQYFTYLLEFTEAELERTWVNMILPNIELAIPEEH